MNRNQAQGAGYPHGPEVGQIYEGVVKHTSATGAIVEILPGIEGLCPISELQESPVATTEDVLTRGDTVRVKLLAIDERGRLHLSRRAAVAESDVPSAPISYLFVDPVPDYRR